MIKREIVVKIRLLDINGCEIFKMTKENQKITKGNFGKDNILVNWSFFFACHVYALAKNIVECTYADNLL